MSQNASSEPLRILQVLRAPIGGLFRHVCDLALALAARGHHIGIVCDSSTGGEAAAQKISSLETACSLGIHRLAMGRLPGLGDLSTTRYVRQIIERTNVSVVHGHGAKGGAYSRLAARPHLARLYTPHGGSLHYAPYSPAGIVFLTLERLLLRRSDAVIFESAYARQAFCAKIAEPKCLSPVIHNGLAESEFTPVRPGPREFDVLFVGELRALKGVAVLLEAIQRLQTSGAPIKCLIVGDGPDRERFERTAAALGIDSLVTFAGAAPARPQFERAHVLVVPSLAESLPYVILEAGAAGLPVIATNVGGIPEIFGDRSDRLIAPGDAGHLAAAIRKAVEHPQDSLRDAERLRARLRNQFTIAAMTDQIETLYHRLATAG